MYGAVRRVHGQRDVVAPPIHPPHLGSPAPTRQRKPYAGFDAGAPLGSSRGARHLRLPRITPGSASRRPSPRHARTVRILAVVTAIVRRVGTGWPAPLHECTGGRARAPGATTVLRARPSSASNRADQPFFLPFPTHAPSRPCAFFGTSPPRCVRTHVRMAHPAFPRTRRAPTQAASPPASPGPPSRFPAHPLDREATD